MRRFLPLLLIAMTGTACGSSENTVRDLAALRKAPLYTFNDRELDAYLRWFHAQPLAATDRAVVLGRKNIGQPYRLGLLGEYPFEIYDPQPLFCLSASDCVTFVEHCYAMALSRDWASFIRVLQRLRYQDGRIGILTRNHFMEADWNVNNDWLFEDVTMSLPGGDPQPMRTVIDRAGLLKQHGIIVDLRIEIVEDAFIPRDCLSSVLPHLRDGDIIELVRGDERSQHVSHIGLLAHDPAGKVTLLHSGAPAVREESLEGYLQRHPNVLGFKILRMLTEGSELDEEHERRDEQVVRR